MQWVKQLEVEIFLCKLETLGIPDGWFCFPALDRCAPHYSVGQIFLPLAAGRPAAEAGVAGEGRNLCELFAEKGSVSIRARVFEQYRNQGGQRKPLFGGLA